MIDFLAFSDELQKIAESEAGGTPTPADRVSENAGPSFDPSERRKDVRRGLAVAAAPLAAYAAFKGGKHLVGKANAALTAKVQSLAHEAGQHAIKGAKKEVADTVKRPFHSLRERISKAIAPKVSQ